MQKTVITSHENQQSAAATTAFGQTPEAILRALTTHAFQLTKRSEFCLLVSGLYPLQRRAVTRPPWVPVKSRRFSPVWLTSARFRHPHTVRRWRPCCSCTARCLCLDVPWLQEIGRPRPTRCLPVVLTPDEVIRILRFSGRGASFVRPASLWNRHADQ